MKNMILLIPTLVLSGCLSQGGGSPAAAAKLINEPVVVSPTPTPTPSPTPASFSYSSFQGKALSMSNGSLTFSSTEVTDSRCGARYTIDSVNEADGVVTVEASIIEASWSYPGNNDCLIDPINHNTVTNTCTPSLLASNLVAYKITYSIEEISGGIAVSRALKTNSIKRNCITPVIIERESKAMSEELYYE